MEAKLDNTTDPQHDAKLPVSGSKKHSWKQVDKGHSICRNCGLHRFTEYNDGHRRYGDMNIRRMKYQECR